MAARLSEREAVEASEFGMRLSDAIQAKGRLLSLEVLQVRPEAFYYRESFAGAMMEQPVAGKKIAGRFQDETRLGDQENLGQHCS